MLKCIMFFLSITFRHIHIANQEIIFHFAKSQIIQHHPVTMLAAIYLNCYPLFKIVIWSTEFLKLVCHVVPCFNIGILFKNIF